ncbi:leucyl aminopeptidase [Blochmannia endosymbiont of Camponotus (Colobopsis) obliquus]|uniref:leucyl aminopeptidase n=1 Tax=Blochmannia endosymbiont of Camponotus (Colobopsis) obliquus TaxID=1505597 RepID=UPI00061A722F|nr:leucyl aminopeptidase [Blochmannia endosymbiont of Camponotus (Colobopsis) obliquus]AKC60219.1 cytosol aminopeptidase [Blochmannia endosymbiont of Camponotus (Colobopsis) obliquus]
MKFNMKKIDLTKEHNAFVVIGVFEKQQLSYSGNKINDLSEGYIKYNLHASNFTGKIGETLFLYNIPNFPSKHILLIGCGKDTEITDKKYKKIIHKLTNALINTIFTKSIYYLNEINVISRNQYWKIKQSVEIICEILYTFEQFKTKNKKKHCKIDNIIFPITNEQSIQDGQKAIQHGLAIANSINNTKNLANMPPNICNANYLANKLQQLSNNNDKTNISIINEQQMKKLGMNSYVAVGQGSSNKTIMSIIKYQGHPNKNTKPIILIGKGVTFDSGGLSIKTSDKLDEMKFDMCGAAATYGVMHMAINLKLPLNIIGVIAGCENMISNKSLRPGDILSSLSGQTIEVLNTDAEGRLILCDTLTYIEKFDPEIVIDIATLTGACIIALGHHYSALMSNYQPLANELILASRQSGDYIWQLPLVEEFQEQLKSNLADMKNVGGKAAGTITAGCFLSKFTKKYHWAHLDIAGTAWTSEPNKNATGRPVALLSQFLLNRVNSNKQLNE